jgi:hypothetical protein
MKRIIYLFLTLSILLFSCEKTPVASFSADTNDPIVGQPVGFNNNSHNGDRFEWDFGDGYTSNDVDPIHTFTATGSYDVTLTAISKGGLSDKAVLNLNVAIPTLLEIEVREYYSQAVVPDASIILYSSITDWDAQKNMVIEGFADADGVAVFSDLDPFVYYVDVWEKTHDNYTLRAEDVGFIRTPEILPHKINRFIAWVDIANHPSGVVSGRENYIIKRLERKAADMRQPAVVSGTEGWQILYNRSVKK